MAVLVAAGTGISVAVASASSTTPDYAGSGSGALTVSPASLYQESSDNTLTFTYTAALGGTSAGMLYVNLPAGFDNAPTTAPGQPGYTTSNCGGVSTSGGSIVISGMTLSGGSSCTITYGSFEAPLVGDYPFDAAEASTSDASPTELASQPSVEVTYSPDGSGSMAVSPPSVSVGSTGNTLMFTYTPAVGGASSGTLTVTVPPGWSPPSRSPGQAGYTWSSGCGTVAISGMRVTVSGISFIGPGGSCNLYYESAKAPSVGGTSTFDVEEQSTAAGTLEPLSSMPRVQANYAAAGSGTMAVSPRSVFVNTSGNTLTFTYSPAPGGTASGGLTVAVPPGWSPPNTTKGKAGYAASTCGVVTTSGMAVRIAGMSLAPASHCTISYHSNAPTTGRTSSFTIDERSLTTQGPKALAAMPIVAATYAPPGSGRATVSPGSVIAGSSGNTLTFTYTAAPGGIDKGDLILNVPPNEGWSSPTGRKGQPGYTTTTCGTLPNDFPAVVVLGLDLEGGRSCTFTYHSAKAPAKTGTSIFLIYEQSTHSGKGAELASSPKVVRTKASKKK